METEEIKQEFEKTKKKLNFKSTFEEIDEVFYISDFINEKGYISNQFSRQLSSRMIDNYAKWNEFFHRILMPTPGSIVVSEESKLFDENDRKEIMIIFNQIMEFISRNSIIGVNKDDTKASILIDEMMDFWKSKKSTINKYLEKINTMWKEKIHEKAERVSYSG